jgi:hypothetical protein
VVTVGAKKETPYRKASARMGRPLGLRNPGVLPVRADFQPLANRRSITVALGENQTLAGEKGGQADGKSDLTDSQPAETGARPRKE